MITQKLFHAVIIVIRANTKCTIVVGKAIGKVAMKAAIYSQRALIWFASHVMVPKTP